MNPEDKIKQLEKKVAELRELLVTDELTSILNRRGLMDSLKILVNETLFQLNNPERRRSVIIRGFSLLFIDVDHFKKINDTHGHAAGDLVLKTICKLIRDQLRGIDIVGRYGGEEIVVGLVGAEARHAKVIAEDLRQKIAAKAFTFQGKTIPVKASFGVATLAADMTLDDLLKTADAALYEAKNTGRNKVVAR